MLNKDKFLGELRAHIAREHINQVSAAKEWGCSSALISAVVRGDKQVPAWIAEKIGYKPVKSITYTFEEIKE